MMDDIAEQQDVAREISDAISNPVAFGQDADEDELEKELEELQQEELDKELLGIDDTATDELPSVPTSVPAVPSKSRTSNYYFFNTFLFSILFIIKIELRIIVHSYARNVQLR